MTDIGDKFLTNVLLFYYNRIYTKQKTSLLYIITQLITLVLRVINYIQES